MENDLKLLRKLQEFDLEIEEIHDRIELQQARYEELSSAYNRLNADLTAQRSKLDLIKADKRQKELELKDITANLDAHKEKQLRASNARELAALDKELDALRRRRVQVEEEIEQLSDSVTDGQDNVEEQQSRLDELATDLAAQEADMKAETDGSEGRVKALETERDDVKASFAGSIALIRRYEFIRSRMEGRVIVVARNGACSGCHMLVPPQTYNDLMTSEKVIQCPSCKRILYYEPPV